MFVAPVWIFPLFNTFTPLPEGELKHTLTLALAPALAPALTLPPTLTLALTLFLTPHPNTSP